MSDAFWRLPHEDLAAVLGRPDLSWETARVYLALADLTLGYGKEKDTVSLGQIAEIAGMDRSHVVRALKRLSELGLYGQEQVSTQKVIRWVTWPPPPVAGAGTTAPTGNTTAAEAGNRTVAKGVAKAGTHQDSKKEETSRKRPPSTKFVPPTASEVRQYADSVGYTNLDADHFIRYYAADGWKLSNGRPMRAWRRAVLTWQSRDRQSRKEHFNGHGRDHRNEASAGQASRSRTDREPFTRQTSAYGSEVEV